MVSTVCVFLRSELIAADAANVTSFVDSTKQVHPVYVTMGENSVYIISEFTVVV